MMEVAQVAVCSQINTKHLNAVWAEQTILELVHYWCIAKPVGFERVNRRRPVLDVYSTIWDANQLTKPSPHSTRYLLLQKSMEVLNIFFSVLLIISESPVDTPHESGVMGM
jgi:hypothetical protein